jgi:hypothetical protein
MKLTKVALLQDFVHDDYGVNINTDKVSGTREGKRSAQVTKRDF